MTDALLARSIDAEQDFLACCAVDPRLLRELGVTEAHFSGRETRLVFQCLTDLAEAGIESTSDTVMDWALSARTGRLDPLWLWTVPPMLPEVHADRLKRFRAIRETRDGIAAAMLAASEGDLDAVDKAIAEVSQKRAADLRGIPGGKIGEVARQAMIAAVERASSPIKCRLFIERFDYAIGHIGPGEMLLLGAGTNVGKTSAALGIAMRSAANGIPTGYISHEDGAVALGLKALSKQAKIPTRELRSATGLRQNDAAAISEGVGALADLPLWLRFPIGGTELDTVASIRWMASQGVRKVVVDYVQTINASFRASTRRDEIRLIASTIKRAAAEFGMALTLNSQIVRPPKPDRPGTQHRAQIPTLHDFKEAGDLENMADYAVGLWRCEPGAPHIYGKVLKSKWEGVGALFRLQQTNAGILDDDPGWDGMLPQEAEPARTNGLAGYGRQGGYT